MKYRSILLHCTPTAVLMHTLSYTYVPYPFGDQGILVVWPWDNETTYVRIFCIY